MASASRHKPGSLMARLALVTGTAFSNSMDVSEARSGPGERRSPAVATYFGLGLVGGGAAGAVLLAMLPLVAAGATRQPEVPPAIAALAPWVSEANIPRTAAARPKPAPAAAIEAFDITIDRTASGIAPFGLRLIGAADVEGMRIVLRDMPSGVVPSRGERQEASHWSLPARELESLRLKLAEGAPHAFTVRIDVLTPAGVVTAKSLARVRVVDVPEPDPETAPPIEAAPAVPPAPPSRVAQTAASPPLERPRAHARHGVPAASREKAPRVAPHPAPPAVAAAVDTAAVAEERHFPEGASGLGAISRSSERQIWWRLPPPSWSPFKDTVTAR